MRYWITFLIFIMLPCAHAQWNNPHLPATQKNILHGAFASTPKTLDPAKSYSSDETQIIAQIYEPPLQYDFNARPFQLIPLTLTEMPSVTYLDKNKKALPKNTDPRKAAYTVYTLKIKPGIYYQPHPAFAKQVQASNIHTINDFKNLSTRELTANDYVYQIKRLASPTVHSPIFGVMEKYIVGFSEFSKQIENAYQLQKDRGVANPVVNLAQYNLPGVKVVSRFEYQITIKGVYPQFLYWLAMPFFSPMPPEADAFYENPILKDKNITLDWYPIGTGPYLLLENNPNQKIVLNKNPNFTHEKSPQVDQLILSLDKESIPRWNKFLQGYYDRSGVSADSFDQAIQLDKNGDAVLTESMKAKGIRLEKTINPSIFYIGFNMQDPTVGTLNEKNKKLRQAIAIAIDYEEYIQLFLNGRGIAAQSPIPPGIFGYETGNGHFNSVVYFWDGNKISRKPIDAAKKLLAQAGYPNGIDPATKKPLVLNYDVASLANADDKSQLNWMRKQFAKLGIQLNIRQTDYNRFQEKVRTGNAQIFSWGWLADYPDPENFLFLLHGSNGKVKFGGENASNYENRQFDMLFETMKSMPNDKKRLTLIHTLLTIAQEDTPWIFGIHPIDFTLTHQWVAPLAPHPIANNTLKYQRINAIARTQLQKKWNQPILWPLWLLLGFLILIFVPLMVTYWKRENSAGVERF